MNTIAAKFWSVLSPAWWAGPIFGKELRVSSRRRRNYVLRFAYVALLAAFLMLFWAEAVPSTSSGLYRASQMAEVGRAVVVFLVWFQFIALQVVAGVMLSTSISDEIYHGTLGLLMTTPITSLQIVTGKLLSKLLQLVLLLGISLPLLAIVRVFGGVPWMFIVVSLCITLTTLVFIGSLSLFFSIFSKRAYVVIIWNLLTLVTLFALLPIFVGLAFHGPFTVSQFFQVLSYLNPYVRLFYETDAVTSARTFLGSWSWAVHCGLMLGVSALLLLLSVSTVRKVALRQATGQLGTSRSKHRPGPALPAESQPPSFAAPRRVSGSPVAWKELRTPLVGRRKVAFAVCLTVGLALLLLSYGLFARENALDEDFCHMGYGELFLATGILFSTILPATCISSEKEARTWPLLLTTTLRDRQILFGKFAGAARRCAPAWCLLLGHVLVFTLAGIIHPVAVVQLAILATGVHVFLSGTGLYFSSRFKKTTTAVIVNFFLAGAVWALVPILLQFASLAYYDFDGLVAVYACTNPFVQVATVLDATTGWSALDSYWWPGMRSLNAIQSTTWMLYCMIGYIALGAFACWRAKRRLRRNVF